MTCESMHSRITKAGARIEQEMYSDLNITNNELTEKTSEWSLKNMSKL